MPIKLDVSMLSMLSVHQEFVFKERSAPQTANGTSVERWAWDQDIERVHLSVVGGACGAVKV